MFARRRDTLVTADVATPAASYQQRCRAPRTSPPLRTPTRHGRPTYGHVLGRACVLVASMTVAGQAGRRPQTGTAVRVTCRCCRAGRRTRRLRSKTRSPRPCRRRCRRRCATSSSGGRARATSPGASRCFRRRRGPLTFAGSVSVTYRSFTRRMDRLGDRDELPVAAIGRSQESIVFTGTSPSADAATVDRTGVSADSAVTEQLALYAVCVGGLSALGRVPAHRMSAPARDPRR